MAGIQLPSSAAGVGGQGTSTATTSEQEDEVGIVERIADIPSAVYKAATGEGKEVEFPDVPEATDIDSDDVGFFETLIPNAKIFMTRDDFGKAEIIKNSFEGDERFGGVYSDKFNNPMLVWNDKPYYINKPGFSGQDLGTFVGEIASYIPAMKYVGGAKALKSTIGRGTAAYGGTEIVKQGIEAGMTPETTQAKDRDLSDLGKDVGLATGIGVAADVVLPPAGKAITKTLTTGAKTLSETLPSLPQLPKVFSPKVVQESKYPLTSGQRTAPIPDRRAGPTEKVTTELESEDVLRRAPGTDSQASDIIRGFDERQLDLIREDASKLQSEFGSGRPEVTGQVDVPGAVAEETQSIVSRRAGELKSEAGESYKAVRDAPDQPILSPAGVTDMAERQVNVLNELGITERLMNNMPILKGEISYLTGLLKKANAGKLDEMPLKELHAYQKSLNAASRSAQAGSPEALALSRMKSIVDETVFEGIERGLISGDQAVLDELQKATGLYKTYIGLTGKATGRDSQEKAASRILGMLTNPNYTPRQVANALFGHNKFNPNQSMKLVLQKMKQSLPEEQYGEVIALLKDGVLEKAFSGSGKSGVTRTNIVNNYDDIFVKQKHIVNELFSPEELKRIAQFRNDVMPTLWAEIKLNPSGSGYTILSGLARSGLLEYTKLIPIIGRDIADVAAGVRARSDALNATRQYLDRGNRPLLSSAISGTIRPPVVSEEPAETTGLAEDLSPSARQKIIEAMQQ